MVDQWDGDQACPGPWSRDKNAAQVWSNFPNPLELQASLALSVLGSFFVLCHLFSSYTHRAHSHLKKGKLWAKRKVDLEELAFPAACSGVLKMLFLTKPFLPNAFLLKFCHFPFSFSPWKRKVTYSHRVKNLTSFSISAHFAFFFSFFAFKYSFLEAASSFLFFTEFWRNSHGENYVRKPIYQCTSTWAWTVVVPLEGNLSKPRVDTKIPLQWKLC